MERLPKDFVERMKNELGDEAERFFASYENTHVQTLRINPLKKKNTGGVSSSELPFLLDRVSWCDEGFYYGEDDTPGKHPYHEAGVYYIQEASAMQPVTMLEVKPGMHVLDLCAAPGGKSTQIGAYLMGEGILVSNEIIPNRSKILSENVERMGITNALVLNESPEKLSEIFGGFFDRILVDAPCSGEGMFRKHPEAMDEWSTENVKICANRQRDILTEAIKMLAPGGRMVYSTCTFAREEDEENAKWITQQFEEMTFVEEHRVWPHIDKGEGHYMAVFEKKGEPASSVPRGGYQEDISLKVKKDIQDFYSFLNDCISTDSSVRKKIETGRLHLFGEQLYLLPDDCPNLRGLKVQRPGLHLGTIKKNRFEPGHALSLALGKEDVNGFYEMDTREACSFIEGISIPCDPSIKGWKIMCIDGMSLGWGKAAGGMYKNHYPKGLRKKLN